MPGLPFYSVAAIFLLKCVSGLTLAWIYTKIYRDRSTADVFKLFDDSKYLFEAFYDKPKDFWSMILGLDQGSPYYDTYFSKMGNWNRSYDSGLAILNDNRSIIRLHALLRIISFDSYVVHVMLFNLMSLIGLISIYKVFVAWFVNKEFWLFIAIFLMPSVVCWSSGLLKEAPLILLVGLFVSLVLRWNSNGFKKSDTLQLLLLILGFFVLKIYVLLAILPAVLALLLVNRFKRLGVRFINAAVLVSSAIIIWLVSALVPQFDIMQHLSFMQQSMLRAGFYYDAGSVLNIQPLEPHWWSFLRNLPEALINTAFRPGILDAKNGLQWLAAFENAGIVFFTLLTIGLYKKPETRQKQQIIWFCLTFVLVLYSVMGISTPILGNLVRYRIPALPFYMIALFLLCDLERLKLIVFEIIRYEPRNNSNIRGNIGDR